MSEVHMRRFGFVGSLSHVGIDHLHRCEVLVVGDGKGPDGGPLPARWGGSITVRGDVAGVRRVEGIAIVTGQTDDDVNRCLKSAPDPLVLIACPAAALGEQTIARVARVADSGRKCNVIHVDADTLSEFCRAEDGTMTTERDVMSARAAAQVKVVADAEAAASARRAPVVPPVAPPVPAPEPAAPASLNESSFITPPADPPKAAAKKSTSAAKRK